MPSRRQLLFLLAGAGVPGVLLAQRAAKQAAGQASVGVLMSGGRLDAAAWLQSFRDALARSGISAAVELRFADGKLDALPALAAQLEKRGLAAIVATDETAFKAARAAHGAPVLAGSALTVLDVAPREIELLAGFLPRLSRIAVLVHPGNPAHRPFFNAIGAAAGRKGWRTLGIELEYADEFEQAFDDARKKRIGAVLLADDALFSQNVVYLAELARQRRMAAVGPAPTYASAGCLFSCGEDQQRRFDAIVSQLARLAKEGKRAEPSEFQPAPIPVVVNRRTAKAIGVAVPAAVEKIASFV